MTNLLRYEKNYCLIIVGLFSAILFFSSCSSKTSAKLILSGDKVLVLGDSISEGYGVGQKNSWVANLEKITNWQIINAGVSGDTTEDGLVRLPKLISDNQIHTLIIELGGNDMLRRLPNSLSIKNIENMIDLAKTQNIQVILIAVPEVSVFSTLVNNLSDAKFYNEIAENKKVLLVDGVISEVLSHTKYRLDQIHPNLEGHKYLAEITSEKLRKLNVW